MRITLVRWSMFSWLVVFMGRCGFCSEASPASKPTVEPRAYVYSLKTISQSPDYCGWPTVTKTADGELLAVYSGGRQSHVCPFGRIELIRSADNGKTWSSPTVLVDSILDDRDTGICQTPKGTLLVTWFTSTYWVTHQTDQQKARPDWQKMANEIKSANYRYASIRDQVKDKIDSGTGSSVDQWMVRSDDNGKTWSQPYRVPLMAPHGPAVGTDGSLLWAGKNPSAQSIGFCKSTDDGKTWDMVSIIEPAPEHTAEHYHELHVVEAADGILISHIRNHNELLSGEILQTESRDGGKSWTRPHSIGVYCNAHPSHLLRLKDDMLLMTYGHRKQRQVQARISTDNGKTWSEAVVIAANLHTWDFGYPATAALDDGKLLTVWYEVQPDSPNAVIRQAIWKLDLNYSTISPKH